MGKKVKLIQVDKLVCHERINKKRLHVVMEDLQRTKVLHTPVVVDRKTLLILDGHHRCQAFVQLGIKEIPCLMVNYFDTDIEVTFRRIDMKQVLFKEIVLRKATEGKLFPFKTTKHRLPDRPIINVPIKIIECQH
jgi:hypothetical protein